MFRRRKRSTEDFQEEIRAHLQLEAEDLEAEGLSTQRAHASARQAFGSVALAEERFYQRRRLPWLDDLVRDVRVSLGAMRRAPAFTLAVVLTLAVAIGLNTTIVSVANALLFRPLPVPESDRLVLIHTSDFSGPPYGGSSYPDFIDFQDGSRDIFSGLAAFSEQPMLLSGQGTADRVEAHVVTQDYFPVVRVNAALGRVLTPEDVDAVVVSHGLWQRMFGGDPGIIGRSLGINGTPFVVVGVAPAGFTGLVRGIPADLWMPLETQPALAGRLESRGSRWLRVVGRLADGAGVAQAQAVLHGIARQLHASHARAWTDVRNEARRVTVQPADEALLIDRAMVVRYMTTLMVIVGVVLLLACVNVANLLLARATVRTQEMAIRLSLGAGRARLVRQLLTEHLLLSVLAGIAGAALAVGATRLFAQFRPPLPMAIAIDLSPDGRVLGFAALASLATALLFGLLPAFRMSRPDVTTALKSSEGGRVGRHLHALALRNALVVVQVALSVLLLVGAGLALRSLMKASAIDIGFEPANVVIASLSPGQQGYDEARGRALYRQVLARLDATPGVRAASLASRVPLGFGGWRTRVQFEGYTPRDGEDMEINVNSVSPRYFETMGIALVTGRAFTDDDAEGRAGVAIVNEALVRRYWPDGQAIGKRIRRGDADLTVVGVVRDGKYRSLSEDPLPYFYLSLWQQHQAQTTVHVRTNGPSAGAASAIRATARELDPALAIFDVRTLEDHLGFAFLLPRVTSVLLGTFGVLALGLAVVGIYSVTAYAASQRRREVGIRMALGAQVGDVLRLILRQGLVVVAAGVGVGVIGAFILTRFAASLLYGISPTDPGSFTGAVALLAVAGLAAALVPALRAARIQPTDALRRR